MKKILVLDVSAIIYRSHFALLNLRNSKGVSTGATYGLIKQLEQAIEYFKPDYIFAAKDVKRKDLKRTEIYSEYKSNRESMPEELVSQLENIDRIIEAYGIKIIRVDGYEADDVMGTLSNKYSNDYEVIIISGDKDLSQLVKNNVKVAILGKSNSNAPYLELRNDEEVKEYLGVYPNQIIDYFGLIGDSSDGIPGVKGVGPKTGVKLIEEYGNLDNIYENIDNIKGSLKDKLLSSKDIAYVSKKLATIYENIPLEIDLEEAKVSSKDNKVLSEIYLEYNFKQEYEKIMENMNENIEIKEKEHFNLSDFIQSLNEEKKEVSLYYSEEGISYFNGKEVNYCLDITENIGDLFSSMYGIKDISNDLDLIIYSNKEWLNLGLNFKKYFDVLIAAFSLGTDKVKSVESLIFDNLHISIEEFSKKKVSKIDKSEIDEILKNRLVKISYGLYKLKEIFSKDLISISKENNYLEELKFTKVLKYMEEQGILIDENYFKEYNLEIQEKITEVEKKIYEESGEKFNISSPKQLGEILFEKLEIEGVKKNKKGYSTDASVLELLKLRGIKIAEYILTYRELEKLRSTYIEPLLKLAVNSRIYSSFIQTGTATGRLSSQNPNLQNIPTRTEEGMRIREGFIGGKGKKLISFDYSQIELRILAELSKDDNLIDAYNKNLDLHELTARKIFKLSDEEKVDKYQRNIAKVINFSVLYGKTPYGLSKELKITLGDAKEYIDTYFKEYPKVRLFIDNIIEKAKEDNYVETLYGTRRYIYDINSSNLNIREQANRMAVNTVIQGTAANIIKKVMYEIYDKLCNDKLKMLVQVHDELIFEVDEDYVYIKEEIEKIMENTIKFEFVKLKVNCNIGNNWMELK